MSETLHKAAQAVLDRWDSPQWEWRQHCPTADLMHTLRAALAQPPAPTAQQKAKSDRVHALVNAGPLPGMSEAFDAHMGAACWTDPAYAPDASMWAAAWKAAQPVQQPGAEPMQGGMDNAELLAAWKNKLPGVEPSDAQLTAFAVGVEVGFSHARDLERQDWSRVHHALAKHGVHPGRTDDHLADVIDRALASPAQRQPLSDEEIEAIWKAHVLPGFGERQRFYSPVVYARAIEFAHGIAAQKGEKL